VSQPFSEGDLVEAGGDRWTVISYQPARPYLAGTVTVGRTTAGDASVHSVVRAFPEAEVTLVTRMLDRTMIMQRHPGGLVICRDKAGDVILTYIEGEK
jgi:hypothetical protein